MSVKTIEDMVLNIKNTLSKNGFPQKAVALPLERLYEAAHRDGLNFNKVLSELAAAGIEHEKTSEKVIFREKPAAQTSDSGLNMDALKNLNLPNMDFSKMNMGDMMSQAKELRSVGS